jgi:hypothetical protein
LQSFVELHLQYRGADGFAQSHERGRKNYLKYTEKPVFAIRIVRISTFLPCYNSVTKSNKAVFSLHLLDLKHRFTLRHKHFYTHGFNVMDLHKDLEALKQASLSCLFEKADLERVFNAGKQISLKKGQVLFAEGSCQETMYIILSGKMEVYKKHKQIAVRETGDFLGEMALVESKPRSA